MTRNVNVFFSHRWDQDDIENQKIRDELHSDNYYNFNFFEISKKDFEEGNGIDTKIKQNIRNRIGFATVVIALNNQTISYNTDSLHFYEIKQAMEKEKPIILVMKQGSYEIPSIYKDYPKLEKANWNFNSIREAVKRAI